MITVPFRLLTRLSCRVAGGHLHVAEPNLKGICAMTWLHNLTISRRTTLVIGTLLTMLILVAGMAVWNVRDISRDLQSLSTEQVERVALSQRWDANIREAVARWQAAALASNSPVYPVTKEVTLAISTETTAVQKRFKEIELSEGGLALGKRLGEARARWLAERDAVRKAIEAGDHPTALSLGQGSFLAMSTEYLQVSKEHAAYQIERAKAEGEAQIAQAHRKLTWTLVLVAACVIGSVLLGMAFVRSLVRPLGLAVQAADHIAGGDLTHVVRAEGRDEVANLLRSLEVMRQRLNGLMTSINQSAGSISTASSEIAIGNTDLSTRTEQTASNLQQAANSMEQLTGTVHQTVDSARTANQLAASAATVAQRGGQVVSQVVSTMGEIQTASKKIADIIGTIDGIAFQTNILALNAAVEAARAGEQGRGFAVVASEVRSLAGRSAEAAKQIKSLIGASVEKVDSGSRLVSDAGQTMTELVTSVNLVSDTISQISAATSEQSDGLGQINAAVTDLDRMTQQNAALVEEAAAAAESLKSQALSLSELVASFRVEGSRR